MGAQVLVTGGSGFVGGHCIVRLLHDGHHVRATVRSPQREEEVRAAVRAAGADLDRLSFAVADLTGDAGWPEAVAGSDFVLHVASPMPPTVPRDENDLIVPARDGTMRVLRAARDANVRRVVMTSSFAAIGYGHERGRETFDERDWTDATADVGPYVRSKTLAERAAWDFVAAEGGGMELAVINPAVVLGPALGPGCPSSLMLVQQLLLGGLPRLLRLSFGVVDVRDVADLHVRAMTEPKAAGERFLAVAGDVVTMRELALVLRDRLGAAAARVPVKVAPDWVVWLFARFDRSVAQIVPDLGRVRRPVGDAAWRILGWRPRSAEDAIVAAGRSLLAREAASDSGTITA
ncbi:NAD-dependent epimerase/dehydratase family protein [Mangrovihabitans endophyticus]|uniref:Dihydroflavonol-4-reductase n=1 Tax=Mangrovihabitans endophyticus TaxID=1751298 RepID=A0A8J3FQ31_9ACTN|nr:NAD-dependent epimerase/dehydratase family protein [Mangrovihabitans endophyticus]GGK97538.1 dihydroflavonol-4-reductase [Mangrovihabitans endophyticus]